METYVVRLLLPDRPGALEAVASRIGAVRGDVIGIDILETGDGRAIDELVVRLPREAPVSLLISEIQEVDGADVEFVRLLGMGADAGCRHGDRGGAYPERVPQPGAPPALGAGPHRRYPVS